MKGSFKQKTTIRTKRQSEEAKVTSSATGVPLTVESLLGLLGRSVWSSVAGDAFAGQLEKGSGYIWSQPLTGEHLNAAWFLSPNKKRGTKCFFRLKKEFGFFTKKLFAESSLLFLFSACFVIYCFFGSLEAAQSVRRANTLIMQQCFVILKAERITHNILGLHTTLVGSVDSGIIMCFLTFPVWFSVLLT